MLVGLTATRARADAECVKLSCLLKDIAAEMQKAASVRDACDNLIGRLYPELDVGAIKPVRALKGKYGGKGGLQQAIAEELRSAYPEPMTTVDIAHAMCERFSVKLHTTQQRRDFRRNIAATLSNILYSNSGPCVRRLHDPTKPVSAGQWVWVPPGDSRPLADQATAAGVSVTFSNTADPPDLPDSEDADDNLPR